MIEHSRPGDIFLLLAGNITLPLKPVHSPIKRILNQPKLTFAALIQGLRNLIAVHILVLKKVKDKHG